MSIKLKYPDYFKLNEYHLCQFCGVHIRNPINGKFSPNNNFKQATYHLSNPDNGNATKYVITGCTKCLKQIRDKDKELLQAVYDNDKATSEGFIVENNPNFKRI